MRRMLAAIPVVFLVLTCAAWQFNVPIGGSHDSGPSKNTRVTSRTLTGKVLDKSDQPIPGAVVYLKNSKTLAIKSFFADKDGSYRFPSLALNLDYEVWAEKDGRKSDAKTLSQFDSRATVNIILRIDMKK